MSSDMQFWSLAVPPGGSETQDIEQTPETAVYLHLTNVALAGDGGGVPHTIAVTVNGKQCVLATLQKGQAMQHTLDVLLDESVTFTNSGKAPVHVSGYLTMSSADDYEGESEDDEDEDEDEDDEDAPMGVPLQNGKPKRKLLQSPGDDDDDDADDDDDDDDEGEEEDEEDDGPNLKPSKRLEEAMYGEGDSDDEGGEFELGSDDIVGEFEDDEDEGEEEDEDEEEEQKKVELPKGKAQAGKRAPVTTTPAPAAKKAKTEVAKAPASAPPKMQKQKQDKQEAPAQKQPATAQKPAAAKATAAAGPSDGGDAVKSYEKLLVDYLSKQPNKTATLSQLGTNVKRPPGVQKLTAFLKSKPGQFKHDEKGGTVALLK